MLAHVIVLSVSVERCNAFSKSRGLLQFMAPAQCSHHACMCCMNVTIHGLTDFGLLT